MCITMIVSMDTFLLKQKEHSFIHKQYLKITGSKKLRPSYIVS